MSGLEPNPYTSDVLKHIAMLHRFHPWLTAQDIARVLSFDADPNVVQKMMDYIESGAAAANRFLVSPANNFVSASAGADAIAAQLGGLKLAAKTQAAQTQSNSRAPGTAQGTKRAGQKDATIEQEGIEQEHIDNEQWQRRMIKDVVDYFQAKHAEEENQMALD